MIKPRQIIAALLLGAAMVASAESWRTRKGRVLDGTLSGIYGDLVIVGTKGGSWQGKIDDLDDASLGQVAAFLANRPKPAVWSQSDSAMAKAFSKRLLYLQDRKLVGFDPGSRLEPEFYAIYFGAYWCGPCRRFSPRLVEAYTRMQAHSPGRFEVVFVSDDVNYGGQLDYAREVNMPWPILRFASCGKLPVIDRWRGKGIPCLVVLNRDGELIYHSYRDQEYLGPDDPMEKLETLLEATRGGIESKPAVHLHRLAVARHLLAAKGAALAPKAYLISLDFARAATLPAQLQARVVIDIEGRVKDVRFTPQLDAVTEDLLTRLADQWLFLPAARDGQAAEATVEIPIVDRRS